MHRAGIRAWFTVIWQVYKVSLVYRPACGKGPGSPSPAPALLLLRFLEHPPNPAAGPGAAFSQLNHPHPQLSHCPAFWPPGLLWLSCKPSGLWKSNLTVEENEKVGVFSCCMRAWGWLIIRWPGGNGRSELRNYSQDPWWSIGNWEGEENILVLKKSAILRYSYIK